MENVTRSVVIGNIVDHNTNAGIALVDGSAGNEVKSNRSFDNAKRFERAAAGIRLYEAHANTVTRNISHDNEDSEIELDRSDDNVVSNNVSYQNGDHGLDVTGGSSRTRVLANTIYDNVTAGINVEGGSTNATVANNISVENGLDSPRTHSNIRVDAASVPGTSLDYDLVYLDGGEHLVIWKSVGYRSLAAFRAATGQERHGLEVDPKWRNRAAGNFHLAARSPAIDSASSRVRRQPGIDIDGTRRALVEAATHASTAREHRHRYRQTKAHASAILRTNPTFLDRSRSALTLRAEATGVPAWRPHGCAGKRQACPPASSESRAETAPALHGGKSRCHYT